MMVHHFLRLFGLPLLLLLSIVAFSLATPTFLTAQNLSGLLQSVAISILMFTALTWVFTIGEMDVSFVAVAALANMIVAGLVNAGFGWGIASLFALAASASVGLLNGLLIGGLRLPSLIITIATGGMASALAAAIGSGSSMPIDAPSFWQRLFDVQIGVVSLVVMTAALLVLLCWIIESRLVLGHYIFALATNRRAVEEAGVPVTRIVVLLMTFSSVMAGFAGLLLAVQLSSGQPSIAASLFIDGLTAVLLGGAMLKLGKPNILGTVTGILLIAVLVRGGALLGWSDASFQIVKGVLLLGGIAAVMLSHRKGSH